MSENKLTKNSLFEQLKNYTNARIGLDTSGDSLSTTEILKMRLALSNAKSTIFEELNTKELSLKLNANALLISSKINSKEEYLKRPDLGRILNQESVEQLSKTSSPDGIDLIFADGLSSIGINKYSQEIYSLINKKFHENNLKINHTLICKYGRVGIGDHIGEVLKSKMTILIIGERPGLTTFDSVGIYMTYTPRLKFSDAQRNCISNICETGLAPILAVDTLTYLVKNSLIQKISGVNLKDQLLPPI